MKNITNFKKLEFNQNSDLDNEDLDKIKILIIDILLLLFSILNDKKFKVFFNLFGLIKKAEIIKI